MANPNLEPAEIRIIKKKKTSGQRHGGAWKVAYADFVTAMMALFIVLWIMSQSQSIRVAVAQYFKNPGLLPGAVSLMETSDMGGKMPTPGHSQELQTPSPIPPETSQDRNSLEEVKKRLEEMIAQLPELHKLKDQVLLEITSEGLRIELLERENSNFFDIGSANLKTETKKILNLIAQELGGLPNQVTVEGHTDSRPYGNQNYTNWELSADRANAARRLMEMSGLKPHQVLAVRGFADRHLRNPQDSLDFQNRRVSIIVMFQEKFPAAPRLLKPVPDPKNLSAAGQQAAPLPGQPVDKKMAPAGPDQILSDELKQQLQPLHPQTRLGW
jgi:chemotaxis protein MotB